MRPAADLEGAIGFGVLSEHPCLRCDQQRARDFCIQRNWRAISDYSSVCVLHCSSLTLTLVTAVFTRR